MSIVASAPPMPDEDAPPAYTPYAPEHAPPPFDAAAGPPLVAGFKALVPPGWEIAEDKGRISFISPLGERTFTDPRALPPGWTVSAGPSGSSVFVEKASGRQLTEHPCSKARSEWIEERRDANGTIFYIDHFLKTTSWTDPRLAPGIFGNTFPAGWEQRVTNSGAIYYVDHNTRTTHWELPPHALHRDLPYSFPAGTLYPGVDLGAGAAVGTMGAGAGIAMGAGAASAMSYRSGSVSSTVSSPMSPSPMSPSAAAKAAEAAAAVGTTHAPDRNAVLKEGVLGKRGVINSSFQKRLFRLYCDRMEYYNSPSDRMAKGTINLLNARVTPPFKHAIAIHSPMQKRTFQLRGTDAELRDWYDMLSDVLARQRI